MAVYGDERPLLAPRNCVRFLCSHGGKILPRPSDGQLKYVGGETRIVAVPRDITFSELMNKLARLFKSNVVLKYQLMPEDLDALVSVTCDEDLRNMFDEFDFHIAMRSRDGRSARMRAFLFPLTPITMDTQISISNTNEMDLDGGLEQHYIEAINGITRTISDLGPSIYSIFSSVSSQNSSNRGSDAPHPSCQYRPKPELHRVYSSPNLLSSGQQHSQHQLYNQSRLQRPGPRLMTTQSDVARYNIDQLARRYRTPVRHRNGHCSTVLKDGQIVNVIDTPGFFDFSSGSECITKEILKRICLGKDEIHAILLVYSVRTLFSRQEEASLQSFLEFFGEKITNYIILVFTGGDELEDNDETLAEHSGSGCPQPLKELIHQCNGGVVLFDNRTTDRTKRDNQVQQLLSMVNRVVRENGALPASNENFKLLKEHSLMLHDTKELKSLKGDTKNETSEMEQFHHVYIEPSMRRAGKLHLFCLALVAEEGAATLEAEKAVQVALNGAKTLARALIKGGKCAIQ
ncbi:hypothetical protein AAC387_Pa01g0439 [Persea americana]